MTTRHVEDFDPYDGEGADNYPRPFDWQAPRTAGSFLMVYGAGLLVGILILRWWFG